MQRLNLFLDILDDIFKKVYKKDNWRNILDKISELFEADVCGLGFIEEGKYIVYRFYNSKAEKLQFKPEQGKVDIERIQKYYLKDKNQEFVIINDYQNFPYGIDYYKERGIKSLLLSLIKDEDFYFGNLAIASLGNKKFTEEDGKLAVKLAKVISQVLKIQYLSTKLRRYNDFLKRQINLFKSLSAPTKSNLYEWFIEIFKEFSKLFSLDFAILYLPKFSLGTYYFKKRTFLFEDQNIWKCVLESIKINGIFLRDFIKNFKTCFMDFNTKLTLPENPKKSSFIDTTYKSVILMKIPFKENLEAFGLFALKEDISIFKDDIKRFFEAILLFLSLILHLIYHKENKSIISPFEEDLILSLLKFIEARDPYTKGHSLRVALYAQKIGEILFNKDFGRELYIAGLFHDIGKIGIPDSILLKPGKLTDYEYEIIKYHPILSYELIKNVPNLEKVKDIVLYHHENYDGTGYPKGLKGEEIPLGARILSIVDIFDALTSQRSYRKSLSFEEAIKILKDLSGTKLDPKLVEKIIPILEKYYEFIKNLTFSSFVPEKIQKIKMEYFERDIISKAFIRRKFFEVLRFLVNQNRKFFVILFDLKNTLELNRKYGEDFVDELLEKLISSLQKNFNFFHIARLGDDEFGIIKLREREKLDEDFNFVESLKFFIKKNFNLDLKTKVILFPEETLNYAHLRNKILEIEKELKKSKH